MPRSLSMSLESIALSSTCSFSRIIPDCFNNSYTNVFLPCSTLAMMAILRTSSLKLVILYYFLSRVNSHFSLQLFYYIIYLVKDNYNGVVEMQQKKCKEIFWLLTI